MLCKRIFYTDIILEVTCKLNNESINDMKYIIEIKEINELKWEKYECKYDNECTIININILKKDIKPNKMYLIKCKLNNYKYNIYSLYSNIINIETKLKYKKSALFKIVKNLKDGR